MRVTFVNWFAGALLRPSSPTPFGGVEVRASSFAQGLSRRDGFEVAVVVDDEGQPTFERHGRLEVYSAEAPERLLSLRQRAHFGLFENLERSHAFPGWKLRTFNLGMAWQIPVLAGARVPILGNYLDAPRPEIIDLLAELGSDLVCCFKVTMLSASVIASCRKHALPSVLFLAADDDLSDAYRRRWPPPGRRERRLHYDRLCGYALRNADEIVVQTDHQKKILLEKFGRPGRVIRNPIELSTTEPPPRAGHLYALWIGRAERAKKRPELYVELARRLPERSFQMIANRLIPEVFDELQRRAPPNLEIIERLSFEETEARIAGAAVVVNTSSQEGFPNVFLQAAKHGVPVASLEVDPDGFSSRYGRHAGGDLELLARQVDDLFERPALAREVGLASRRYVEDHHELEGRIDELIDLLREIVPGGS